MRSTRFFALLLFLSMLISFLFSCRDDGFDTNPSIELSFSVDSLLFDTVFTTVGSATRSIRVYNDHSKRIRVSSIGLGGGQDSYFRINVDGRSGFMIQDVEIGAKDSIFIFVEVTVNPVNQNTPMIIVDSLIFNLNGNRQDVKLVAWGQDAIFLYPNYTEPSSGFSYHLIQDNTVWTSELPYVIYGLAVVAPNKTLLVEAGARIYLHNNSSLVFLGGSSLKTQGEKEFPVLFQGDRTEPFYSELPGQWGRIWLTATSKDHDIQYTIIKNGSVGLHVDSIGSYTSPTLRVRNSIIKNMSHVGILAQGSDVVAENTVVANCGEQSLYLALGGKYDFRHCTFANYYNLPNTSLRQTPSVYFNNYYIDINGAIQQRDFVSVFFGNSIVYGSMQEELQFDLVPGSGIDLVFDYCLIRTQQNTDNPSFINIIKNESPQFNDQYSQDYRLRKNSPAINAGKKEIAFQIPHDILGHDRTQRPDLGAYQYYELEDDENN